MGLKFIENEIQYLGEKRRKEAFKNIKHIVEEIFKYINYWDKLPKYNWISTFFSFFTFPKDYKEFFEEEWQNNQILQYLNNLFNMLNELDILNTEPINDFKDFFSTKSKSIISKLFKPLYELLKTETYKKFLMKMNHFSNFDEFNSVFRFIKVQERTQDYISKKYFNNFREQIDLIVKSEKEAREHQRFSFEESFSHSQKIEDLLSKIYLKNEDEKEKMDQSLNFSSKEEEIFFLKFQDKFQIPNFYTWNQELNKVYEKFPQISIFSMDQFHSIMKFYFSHQKTIKDKLINLFHSINPVLQIKSIEKFKIEQNEDFNLMEFVQKLSKLISLKKSIKKRVIKLDKEDMEEIEINLQKKSTQEKSVFFYRLENETQVYDIATYFYFMHCGYFPLKENVLICNQKNTKESDIINFFNIYQFYSKNLKSKTFPDFLFSIFHPQRLSRECTNILIQKIKEFSYETKFPLVIFFYENEVGDFDLVKHFPEYLISRQIEKIPKQSIKSIFQKKSQIDKKNILVFTSSVAGNGKTYNIRRTFYKNYSKADYFHINLAKGNTSEILEKMDLILQNHNKEKEASHFIHIGLPFLPKLETLDFLWTLSMWNSIENKRKMKQNFIWSLKDHSNDILVFEIPSNRKENSQNGLNYFPPLTYYNSIINCEFVSDVFSFNQYKINSENKIEKQKDTELIEAIQNIKLEQKLDKENFFNFLKSELHKKLPGQPITFRLFSNFSSLLKKSINLVDKSYLDSEYTMSEYLGFLVNIVTHFLKWTTKVIKSNETDDLLELLKDKINWEARSIFFSEFFKKNFKKNFKNLNQKSKSK
ncbi:hypothetical protein M0811_09137 [Anaeramoeba ignava]|uniref:Uncharacterized protein n=1 Tax=Anaeramoeba ignava TaxID=1746090 RepID=A0A9Q0LI77_ANAIG|nr:hypothetical protein M0811_09137 [Anaeramoeba ignava]